MILGFKSFADKTVLHFDAGITCIVGPNGCGKSNIADAFRWVLGEQSAKSMRGQKMPDVIFAGTERRKPLNIAEVSITLTDVQGQLPIDYEEVTLTRRLHRSGESEYFINNQQVRLKDIQGLFLDSGIGHQAFSIFEQGKIDQVISYSPMERRYIFEEAAGILRFLQRKKEALKRLEQADLNLSRVRDIHQEVEKQITVLETQADKARLYKRHQLEIEDLEKAHYVLHSDIVEKKLQEVKQKQHIQHGQLESVISQLSNCHERVQQAKLFLIDQEKQFKIKTEERFKWRSEKEMCLKDQQTHQESIQEWQSKEKKFKYQLEDLTLSQQTRRKQLKDSQNKQALIETQFEEAGARLSLQQDRLKAQEEEVAVLRSELQVKQQKKLQLLQQHHQLESEWKQSVIRLENNQEKQKHFEERVKHLTEDQEQLTQMVRERKLQLNQASKLVDTHKERLDLYEEDLKLISKQLEEKLQEIEGLKRHLVEQKAHYQVLLKMREAHEGFSQGSKRLLQESERKESTFYQKIKPLYEYFQVDSSVAEALSAILRFYAHTLVVSKEEDFYQVVQFAETESIQDYSLICLDWIEPDANLQLPGWMTIANPHPLVKHFLAHIQESESHHQAIECFKQQSPHSIWSRQGAFIDNYRVFFHSSGKEGQIFLRESEMKALIETIDLEAEKIKQCEKELNLLQQRKGQLQLERSELDKILRKDEMRLVEVNFGLQRALSDLEKIKKEQAAIEQERGILVQQIVLQQQTIEQSKQKILSAQQDLQILNQEVARTEQAIEAYVSALRIQQQDQKAKYDAYQQLVEQKRQGLHHIHVLEMQEREYEKQVERLQEDLTECQDRYQQLKSQSQRAQMTLQAVEPQLKEAEKACEQIEQTINERRQGLEGLDREAKSYQERLQQTENTLMQLNMQAGQHESMLQSLTQELQESFQLSLEAAREYMPLSSKSLEQIEKSIRSLKQQLQAMGDVNMTSIEELDKHQARFQFLNQQVADLTESKEELLRMIRQLDGESRRLFQETFDVIRKNFQKNFSILFNGGEADLQFTETENILEAGIEIVAKPPGKQMRAISLLSGGEKCLTAVALLFAIFEVKPSPFCILDEIDAPLDDANVERFVNVVKHFADRCQFLIVTHNKHTMAVGDVLFGVSMEEKGVSKLLSLEFSQQTMPALV